jgi:hypothetical protein
LGQTQTKPWSFDLLSTAAETPPRFIEVKGRGTSGPVEVLDRQHDFASRIGQHALLAVVWHAGQPTREQLWTAPDWACLPWQRTREADPQRAEDSTFMRALGLPDRRSQSERALEAEGKWSLASEAVEAHGRRV